MERADVHDQFRCPEKKMYFLKREPLHHGKWKLLDIMKNNSRARARERAIRSSRRMQKAGNFFRPLFLTSAREGNELWAQTGSENVSLFATSMKRASRRDWTVGKCLTIILIFPPTCRNWLKLLSCRCNN